MRYFVTFTNGHEYAVDVVLTSTGETTVTVDGQTFVVDALSSDLPPGIFHARLNGRVYDLNIEGGPPNVGVVRGTTRVYANVESERMRAVGSSSTSGGGGDGKVRSPMPGRVVRLLVAEGAAVAADDPVVVVEAMKMENELVAERDGTVTKVHAAPGATVDGGTVLLEIG